MVTAITFHKIWWTIWVFYLVGFALSATVTSYSAGELWVVTEYYDIDFPDTPRLLYNLICAALSTGALAVLAVVEMPFLNARLFHARLGVQPWVRVVIMTTFLAMWSAAAATTINTCGTVCAQPCEGWCNDAGEAKQRCSCSNNLRSSSLLPTSPYFNNYRDKHVLSIVMIAVSAIMLITAFALKWKSPGKKPSGRVVEVEDRSSVELVHTQPK